METTLQSPCSQRTSVTIFVYGTLLRGQSNHRFLGDARYLGDARTAPEFELLDLGAFPAMVRGGTTAVQGELYALDAEALRVVDELEDHPDFFRRSAVRLEDGRVIESYLLASSDACFPRIPSGDWRELRR